MKDADLLEAVLARSDLEQRCRSAFEGMREMIRRYGSLTLKQRQWVQSVAHALGLPVAKVDPPPKRETRSAWDPEPVKRRRR